MQRLSLATFPPFNALPEPDLQLLEAAVVPRRFEARHEVIGQGERAQSVHFLLSGQTCRSRVLPDGTRQIVAFVLPGESCDLLGCLAPELDHGVMALTPCTLAAIARRTIDQWIAEHAGFARLFLALKVAEDMILREWLVNVASRGAVERIAHLLCEMFTRQQAIGPVDEHGFDFPITQEELGQAIGLSLVHVNRNLKRLKTEQVVTWQRQRVIIHDLDRLKRIAGFDPRYLQIFRETVDVPSDTTGMIAAV